MFQCIYSCLNRNYPQDSTDYTDGTWSKEQIESCQDRCSVDLNGTSYNMDRYECKNECMKQDMSYNVDVGSGAQVINETCESICNEFPEKERKKIPEEKRKVEYTSSLSFIFDS